MREGYSIPLILTIMLCLCLATFAVFLSSDIYDSYRQDLVLSQIRCAAEANSRVSEQSKECQSFIYRTLEDPVAVFTAWLTFATAALFVATGLLYRAAVAQGKDTEQATLASREANAIARQALETSQRPWLGFEHLGPSDVILSANELRIRIPIDARNHGSAPALFVHFGCVLLEVESGTHTWDLLRHLAENAINETARTRSNPTTIFPSQTQRLERTAVNRFTREEVDNSEANPLLVYFILLTYRHPTSGRTHCSASGYSLMLGNVPTYAHEPRVIPHSVHLIPGCNVVM